MNDLLTPADGAIPCPFCGGREATRPVSSTDRLTSDTPLVLPEPSNVAKHARLCPVAFLLGEHSTFIGQAPRPFRETGDRLLEARTAERRLQSEVAGAMQVTPQHYSNMETGHAKLVHGRAVAAARYLHVTVEWLLTGKGQGVMV